MFDKMRQMMSLLGNLPKMREQVEEMQPSGVSLMPEGLLDKLSDIQVRDLFRYLQSQR